MKKYSSPNFWNKKYHFLSLILLPLSLIYFFLVSLNKFIIIFAKNYKIKIICVGNLYLGGTGKTPLVRKIYHSLNKNSNSCILKKYNLSQIDEINFLKNDAKVIVPKKRTEGLLSAISNGFKYVILDDGKQDYSFKKDTSILCIKSNKAFGNERILPSGPLREPLSSIKNYNIAVINGEKNDYIENILVKYNPLIKIFYSYYEIKNLDIFLGKQFLAFSGIADNQSFFDLLNKNNIEIFHNEEFDDHHNFSNIDLQNLIDISRKKNLELITTEKNYFGINEKFKNKIYRTKLNLVIKNYEVFLNEII